MDTSWGATDLRVPEAWKADIMHLLDEEPFENDRLSDAIFCQHVDDIQRFIADLNPDEFEVMAAVRGLTLPQWQRRRLTILFPVREFLLFAEAVLKDDTKYCPKCGRRKTDFIHVHHVGIVAECVIYGGCPVHDDRCEHCPPTSEEKCP